MSGQMFRENVEQALQYLLEARWGTAWGEDEWTLYRAVVDWTVERFGPCPHTGIDQAGACCACGLAPLEPQHVIFNRRCSCGWVSGTDRAEQ